MTFFLTSSVFFVLVLTLDCELTAPILLVTVFTFWPPVECLFFNLSLCLRGIPAYECLFFEQLRLLTQCFTHCAATETGFEPSPTQDGRSLAKHRLLLGPGRESFTSVWWPPLGDSWTVLGPGCSKSQVCHAALFRFLSRLASLGASECPRQTLFDPWQGILLLFKVWSLASHLGQVFVGVGSLPVWTEVFSMYSVTGSALTGRHQQVQT